MLIRYFKAEFGPLFDAMDELHRKRLYQDRRAQETLAAQFDDAQTAYLGRRGLIVVVWLDGVIPDYARRSSRTTDEGHIVCTGDERYKS